MTEVKIHFVFVKIFVMKIWKYITNDCVVRELSQNIAMNVNNRNLVSPLWTNTQTWFMIQIFCNWAIQGAPLSTRHMGTGCSDVMFDNYTRLSIIRTLSWTPASVWSHFELWSDYYCHRRGSSVVWWWYQQQLENILLRCCVVTMSQDWTAWTTREFSDP